MTEPDILKRLREADGGYFMRKMFTEAADEIERLRGELVSTTNRLTEERDEARQWVCIMKAQSVTYACPPEHFARKHGWDCFKEASK